MRRRNWRVVTAGVFLILLAAGFFFFMLPLAARSTDPITFTQTVGQVSGVAAGISVVMIILGLISKKA